jgi:putative DNA primase/helicase
MADDAELVAMIMDDIAENPWPPGYSASSDSVFYNPPKSLQTIWLCDRFKIVAKTADSAKENCGLLLRWYDREGHPHERIVSERTLHMEGGAIAQDLADAGLKVGNTKIHHDCLKQLLNDFRPKRLRLCVNRSGWHETTEGNFTYVMPSGEAFGPGSEDIVLLNPSKDLVGSMQPHGALKEWQENVAKYAAGNHWHGLFLCAALAAPFLGIVKEGTSGVHLVGESQTGKSTALRVASSVWGRATSSQGFIHQWRATDNGLEMVVSHQVV